jgi:Lipid-binding putative hydrolase
MRKIAIYFLAFAAAAVVSACDQDDPNIKGTTGEDIAGEWYVTASVDGTDLGAGHFKIITSNTAANVATEILVSDYVEPNSLEGNFWSFTIKATVSPEDKTISANQVTSSAFVDGEANPIKVNIVEGAILKGIGRSKTGVATDSIYLEMQFGDDDPAFGTTYVLAGHKRTGFAKDDF